MLKTKVKFQINMTKFIAFYKILLIIFIDNLIMKSSLGDETEKKLVRKLFYDYEHVLRPSKHHKATLNVTFGLSLAQIIDVVVFFLFFSKS